VQARRLVRFWAVRELGVSLRDLARGLGGFKTFTTILGKFTNKRFMQDPSSIGIIFFAIAVIFIGVAFRNYLNVEGKMTIARKIWLRMAFVFAIVGIGLYFLQLFVF
jgi:hypothetical protein